MPETHKQLNIRINGPFEKHLTELCKKLDLDNSSVIRYCVKRVYDEEIGQKAPPSSPA